MSDTSLSRRLSLLAALVMVAACGDTSGPPAPDYPAPGSLTVVPRLATIQTGGVITLQAKLVDEFGDRVAAAIEWSSSEDAIASVAPTGEVYGRSAGQAFITATAAGKTQKSIIRVVGEKRGKDPVALLVRRRSY